MANAQIGGFLGAEASNMEIKRAEEGKNVRTSTISEESEQVPAGLQPDSPNPPSSEQVHTPQAASENPVTDGCRPRDGDSSSGQNSTLSSSCTTGHSTETPSFAEEARVEPIRPPTRAQAVPSRIKEHSIPAIRAALPGFFSHTGRDLQGDEVGHVRLDIADAGPWLVDHHFGGLVQRLRKTDACQEDIFRVSFAEMQRMNLRKLQIKLVKHAVTMSHTGDESPDWEKDLAAYTQAMRDYDYMAQCSKKPRDYFLATGERHVDRYIIKRVIKQSIGGLDRLEHLELISPDEHWDDDGRPIGDTRGTMSFQDFRGRVFLGSVGAVLLLGPMWLMVLHKTLYTGLVTTTVCVAVFGIVAVFRLDKPIDVFSATAAYAAVLVVFVGLNT